MRYSKMPANYNAYESNLYLSQILLKILALFALLILQQHQVFEIHRETQIRIEPFLGLHDEFFQEDPFYNRA